MGVAGEIACVQEVGWSSSPDQPTHEGMPQLMPQAKRTSAQTSSAAIGQRGQASSGDPAGDSAASGSRRGGRMARSVSIIALSWQA